MLGHEFAATPGDVHEVGSHFGGSDSGEVSFLALQAAIQYRFKLKVARCHIFLTASFRVRNGPLTRYSAADVCSACIRVATVKGQTGSKQAMDLRGGVCGV